MKLLTRILSLITIVSVSLFFASCGGDGGGGTSTEKVQLKKLTKTWQIVSANLSGGSPADKTPDYVDFTLTLTGTFDSDSNEDFPYDYTTTGRPDLSPWNANGSWGFGSNPKTQIVRDDGLGITYSINSTGQLTLQYMYDGDGFESAKAAEVEGQWTLVLEPAN
jgi:hypothetical protein